MEPRLETQQALSHRHVPDHDQGHSLGAFAVDRFGRISLRDAKGGGLAFRWRGRAFRIAVEEATASRSGEPSECRMTLSACAGRMPSSALAADRRPEAFRMTHGLAPVLPAGWTLTLQADHVLTLTTEIRMTLPAEISALLIQATRFALQLAPYFDLLEQYGMGIEA